MNNDKVIIVGNSPSIFNFRLKDQIDSFDQVVRINHVLKQHNLSQHQLTRRYMILMKILK